MKLLNREPTEDILRAARDSGNTYSEIWGDMFDAAPELTVDMEPVAFYSELCGLTKVPECDCVLYSAAQLAALQAENERLRKENGVKQARIDSLMLEYCPDEMSTEQLKTWGEHQVPAKHEGEKHD